jgi:APA family basic amino acid/polyamine antiporter
VQASPELPRRIGLPAAASLVVGGTIGVGIFLTPATMAAALASPALLLAVWLFIGGSALCGALCFGELGARFPMAGGGYVYLREAFGPRVAFLYGWKCLLVMDPGLTAALATGLGAYAAVMVPGLSPKATALGSIVLVAVANVAGVRMASGIGYALGAAKIVMLVLLVVFGFASGAGQLDRFLPFVARQPGAPALLPALAGALVSAFFSFGGWWEASKLAGEVRDPQRTLPRALALGVATVTLLYVAVSAVFLYLVPREAATSGETFAAQAGAALFGAQGARAFSALVVVSVLGSLFAFMTMAPRVYFAMARDGAVPAFVGKLDPRTGAPVRAIAIQATLALVLVALGTFDAIVAYFVFVTVAFLGLTVAGLVRLKRRLPRVAYETPLYPLPPILFLASISLVLVLLAAGRPLEAALGTLVVAAGVPAYALLRRRPTT